MNRNTVIAIVISGAIIWLAIAMSQHPNVKAAQCSAWDARFDPRYLDGVGCTIEIDGVRFPSANVVVNAGLAKP